MTMITLPPCKKNTIKRFWARVNKNGPQIAYVDDKCWLWTGTFNPSGYGNVNIKSKNYPAHRISWLLKYGDFPDIERPERLFVLHKCDTRPCVNPEHLFLGTHQDNMIDMVEKGRAGTSPNAIKGEANGSAKLTNEQVLKIRRIGRSSCYEDTAKRFGVSPATISNIIRRNNWKHI